MKTASLPITNKADIWSLCTIFSDAIAWTLFGPLEIERYAEERRKETKRKHLPASSDCFHDGVGVLDAVIAMHQDFKAFCEEDDVITPKIIDLIDGILKKRNPEDRYDARSLHVELDRAIEQANEDLSIKYKTRLINASPVSGNGMAYFSNSPNRASSSQQYRQPPPTLPPGHEKGIGTSGYRYPGSGTDSNGLGGSSAQSPIPELVVHSQSSSVARGQKSQSIFTPLQPKIESTYGDSDRELSGIGEHVLNRGTMSAHLVRPEYPPITDELTEAQLPELSVEKAENWMSSRKKLSFWERKRNPGAPEYLLPDGQKLLQRLYDRDHVSVDSLPVIL
jgi:hypothetical protein